MKVSLLGVLGLVALLAAVPAWAETCTAGGEMDAGTKASIDTAARKVFDLASSGDLYNLRAMAAPALSGSFDGVQAMVVQQKSLFAGSQAQIRTRYLLDATGSNAPIAHAEFYCGVYQSPSFATFIIPNLPPAEYALVIQDIATPQGPYQLTTIFQQDVGASWKLAGYYSKPTTWDGHDGNWYLQQARQFGARGQRHNAYLYYLAAEELLPPVKFMTWPAMDKVYDEAQKAAPSDFPVSGPVTMSLAGKAYTITQIFPAHEDTGNILVVKYQAADVSDTTAALNDNMSVIKGLVAKYPELRDGFAGVVARATQSDGRDYGTLLAMKDVK